MKIYRYMWKNGNVKIDAFDYKKRMIEGDIFYKPKHCVSFNKKSLDEILYNYIMWSLSNDKLNYFISLVIEKKEKMIKDYQEKIDIQKSNIKKLKELLEDDK